VIADEPHVPDPEAVSPLTSLAMPLGRSALSGAVARLLVAALPVALVAALASGWLEWRGERARFAVLVEDVAREHARSVDRQLDVHLAGLRSLALGADRTDGFRAAMEIFLAEQAAAGASLALIGQDGAAALAAGPAPAPTPTLPPGAGSVTGRPVISGRLAGGGAASFVIQAPVRGLEGAPSSLVLVLPAGSLPGPAAPPSWTVTLADAAGGTLLERPGASPPVDDGGSARATGRVAASGWSVSVSAPWSDLRASLPGIAAQSFGWAVLALGAVALPGWWVLRRGRAAAPASDVTPAPAASEAALLVAIADATPGLIFARDKDGRMLYANAALLRVIGRSWSEVAGRRLDGWQDDPGRAAAQDSDARVMRTGAPEMVSETLDDAASGAVPRFSISKAPLRDPKTGEVVGIVGFTLDGPERQAVRAARMAADAQISSVLDGMAECFLVMDGEFRIVTANRAALRLAGRPLEDVVGRRHWEVWPASTGDGLEAFYRRVVRDGAAGDIEHRHDEATDGPRWFEVRAQPLAGGGLASFYRDVTKRRRAELAMREAEERFRALVTAAAQVVWTTDALGAVTEESPSWLAFTGQEPGEAQGWGWTAAIHPDDRERVLEDWRRSVAALLVFEREFRLHHHTGEPRWTLCRAVPLLDAEGGVRAWVGMNTDISARREAEARQFLLAREVDHRAKNALAVVQSLVRLTRARDTADFAEAVQGRVAALGRAHTLLSHEHWQGVELRALLLEETAAHAGPAAGNTPRLRIHGPAVKLTPDAVQPMAMAFHELVDNSAAFGALATADGTLQIVWRYNSEGGVELRWQEQGGPPVAGEPQEPGFGSALIQATLVDQLQGRLEFQWKPDGLCVEFTLPSSQVIPMAAPDLADPDLAATDVLRSARVLIVEDEALVALDMARTLRAAGCEVLGPVGGLEQAIRFVETLDQPPDAALLDLNLAGRSSVPLADLLLDQGVPIVFASGYGELPATASRHVESRLLPKPFAPSELTVALREALLRRRSAAQG
jgi:PAS domain S-box-containing protein